jgi:hypothetical protein
MIMETIARPHYMTYEKILEAWQKSWDKTYNVAVSINISSYITKNKLKHAAYSNYVSYKFLNHFTLKQKKIIISIFKKTSKVNMTVKQFTMLVKNNTLNKYDVEKILKHFTYEEVQGTVNLPLMWAERLYR